MAANILFVLVTRGVLADEVVGGLDRWRPVPFYQMLCKVCEGRRKIDHFWRSFNWSGVVCFEQFFTECKKKFMAAIKVEHVFNCVWSTVDTGILNDIFSGKAQG